MKRRYAVLALAFVVGFSTISPALGGPSPAAMVADGAKSLAKRALGKSKKASKRSRRAKRRAKRAKLLAKENAELIAQFQELKGIPGPKGDPGPQGPKGDPGQDAVKLFAFVRDVLDPQVAAEVEYAHGASLASVSDNQSFDGEYTVRFPRRNLNGCVAHATPGTGNPVTGDNWTEYDASISASVQSSSVLVQTADPSGTPKDTSFMLSVFC